MSTFRGADKKLGELMLRGWTMLADSCVSCNCPLMRSPDGQKYCVNCEVWIYDNKKREPKKYNELFQSRIPQLNQKSSEIQQKKEIPKKIEIQENKEKNENQKKEKEVKRPQNKTKIIPNNSSCVDLLNNKLKILAQNLNEETDIQKCNEIIELMNKIINLIKNYKENI